MPGALFAGLGVEEDLITIFFYPTGFMGFTWRCCSGVARVACSGAAASEESHCGISLAGSSE
jgi:hypothetical protein